MQTETLENQDSLLAPINAVAELIDREIHAKTLEQINVLAREYEIRNAPEVALFLRENNFLLDLLEDIPSKLKKFFGSKSKLALELLSEPDFPSSREIFVLVLTEEEAEQARNKMNKFDEKWWLEQLDRARCKLNVSLEYI
ncbi:MAG: hypothetical protein H0U96_08630 [Acidobacteria bacterium]|nr:hypothetical protein [Acidobacteriota bacterium]